MQYSSWMIVQFYNSSNGHHVVFKFERVGRVGKEFRLCSVEDNYGKIKLDARITPANIFSLVQHVYGNTTGYHLIYDPFVTFGAFLSSNPSSSVETIRKKLLADLLFTDRDDIRAAMKVENVREWIVNHTRSWPTLLRPPVPKRGQYSSLEDFVDEEGVSAMLSFLESNPRIINGCYEGTKIPVTKYKVTTFS